MGILSIQSLVAYGHAGNSAALFPLQRLGRVVWPVMTVHFSNHTGYGAWRGPLLAADDVAEVITGVEERGAFAECEAVLSGYQGAEDVGAVVLDAVARVKAASPDAVYCCDPVMGDVGRGMFVRPGIPELMRDRVVPAADVVTPNHFELDFLAGTTSTTLPELLEAADRVRAAGPSVVLVTSAILDDTPEDALDMVAVSADGAWRTRTPRLSVSPPGARRPDHGGVPGQRARRAPAAGRARPHDVLGVRGRRGHGRGRRAGDADRPDPGPARRAADGVRARAAALGRPTRLRRS